MHIILANRWYPPHSGYGGVAAYNAYLGRALVQLGHKVTVIAARWSPDVPEIQEDQGVIVYRLLSLHRPRLHRLPLVGRYMRALEQYRYSRKVAQKINHLLQTDWPNIIEFAEVNAEGFVYLHQAKRCPVVVRCHTPTFVLRNYYRPEEIPYDTRLISAMEKYCIRQADALTAPSHDMARTIAAGCQGISAEQISVIPNALDVDLFAPSTRRNGHPNGSQTILHVGRLDRVKDIVVLTEAIPLVVAEAPHTCFVFVGAGEDWQNRLTARLAEKGAVQCVEFTGGVDQATLIDWYHRADIAVVPSLNYESFSYTVAQAMAAGLPVVASNIGGFPETVGDNIGGLLVSPGNQCALAEAILILARNKSLRLNFGEGGYKRAEKLFSAEIVAHHTLNLYHSLVS